MHSAILDRKNGKPIFALVGQRINYLANGRKNAVHFSVMEGPRAKPVVRPSMSELLKNVDARTRLAGTNKLEILLFSLGLNNRTQRREMFGINVFKVREVLRAPEMTCAPDMPANVAGMVIIRGEIVPIVNLAKYAGIPTDSLARIIIVAEYNGHIHGFLVESVEGILRLDWAEMKVPPDMIAGQMGGLITAVTRHSDGRIVMMMDVEKILSETTQINDETLYKDIPSLGINNRMVLFADDSSIARKQIQRTLDVMNIRNMGSINGKQAWEELKKLADYAASKKIKLNEMLHAVVTDVEMPEMDGYMLTKKIKTDERFSGIPIIMYSSLSSSSNRELGRSVGADEYVPKFEPKKLAEVLHKILA